MSLRAYIEYRGKGISRAWAYAGMTDWCVRWAWRIGFVAFWWALLLWVSSILTGRDHFSALAAQQEARAAHLQDVWLSCLNHGGLWIDGELHLCTLDNTRIREGQFPDEQRLRAGNK